MNTNTRIPNPPPGEGAGLDRLLTDYFRAEMPARWPAAPVPSAIVANPARGVRSAGPDSAQRSRWALAASVALLVGAGWFLSGHATDGRAKKTFDPDRGSASPSVIDKNLGKPAPAPKAHPMPDMP